MGPTTDPPKLTLDDEEFSFYSRHPWRSAFLTFFYTLGAFRMVYDVTNHFLPSWHLNIGAGYVAATVTALCSRFFIPRIPQQSKEEREAEKQVLQQADEILRKAREDQDRVL